MKVHGEIIANKNFSKHVILDILRQYPIEDIMSMDVHQWIEIRKALQLPKQLDLVFIDSNPGTEARKKAYENMVDKLTNNKSNAQVENELNKELDAKNNTIVYKSNSIDDIQTVDNTINSEDEVNTNDFPNLLVRQMSISDRFMVDKCTGETVEFIVEEFVSKWWNAILSDVNNLSIIENCHGAITDKVKEIFFNEYSEVIKIEPDESYKCKYNLSIMQKLMAYRVMSNKGYGNWCGTGAGKTNSVYFSARNINAKISVFVVPNDVIDSMYHIGNDGTKSGSIVDIYPDTNVVICDYNNIPKCDTSKHNIIIINYDKFHQTYTENMIIKLLENNVIDFVCLDEVHKAKVRNPKDPSQTNRNIQKFLIAAREQNPEMRTVVMSATPFVNNLTEVRSVLELMTGKQYNEIGNTTDLENIHNAYKALVLNGFRYIPQFDIEVRTSYPKINGDYIKDEVISLMRGNDSLNIAKLEQLLVGVKLNHINDYLKPGTIIYTEYVNNGQITNTIIDYIRNNTKYSVGVYTGENVSDRYFYKNEFIKGSLDILVCSSPINTGVDHLQDICGNMIILSLPWTHADFCQLIGRIYRQNSKFEGGSIDIIIPNVTISTDDGDLWSYDTYRKSIIDNKKSLGESIMDGSIQSVYNFDKNKLFDEIKEAFLSHCKIDYSDYIREKVNPGELVYNESIIVHTNNFVTDIHRSANTSKTSTIEAIMSDNKGDNWKKYHKAREIAKQSWEEDPVDVIAEMINTEGTGNVIADLGCGLAKLNTLVGSNNKVYSVDFYSENEDVIKADTTNLSDYIKDEELDIAVYCLSLWGTNWKDNFKEAYRMITSKRGELFICEPSNKFGVEGHYGSVDEFVKIVESNGFHLLDKKNRFNFNYFRFIKVK